MEKIGILVISYGSRGAAIADAFSRSEKYSTEIYIVDKQRNPTNSKIAKEHLVLPDLGNNEICQFADKHKENIDFGIVGPEGPIINGIRNIIEEKTKIPIICPLKEYALEKSKVEQRLLIQELIPESNPLFKVFDPIKSKNKGKLIFDLKDWIRELGGVEQCVIKPDKPGYGKGVGVGGEHFTTLEQCLEHFFSLFKTEKVIIEEKIEGEESSFQAWCDGKSLIALPDTRDYKRAFDNDIGVNTGGMGSYKDASDFLPFMTKEDREKEIVLIEKIFKRLRGKANNPGLRGMPLYTAFIHTSTSPKILEINSRPGDPEILNLIPIMRDDFVDICFNMIDQSLKKITFDKKATVAIYKVPPTYGGRETKSDFNKNIDLTKTNFFEREYKGKIRVYPGAVELLKEGIFSMSSRSICVVGIGDDIENARNLALKGVRSIQGNLWNRNDIACKEHINQSKLHMKKLRAM
jgi:phosphoribosylamine--glycine ligase